MIGGRQLVDYYMLLNNRVPKRVWVDIARSHHFGRPLGYTEREIIADVDETVDLRNLIGCILELLRRGYRYEVDFEFSTAG
jgi:hypothetical protein